MTDQPKLSLAVDVRMMWSSGIGSYIRNLVPRAMERLPEVRWTLLGRQEDRGWWESRARQIGWVEVFSPIFSLSEQVELARKIPRGTDLFWSPNYPFPLFWKGRLLSTVHDVFHLFMGKRVGGWPKRFYANFMFRRLARRADSLLAVSQFTRAELIRWAGAPEEKITVVPNGVDPSWFDIPTGPRPHARPYLLAVGNIKPHKNLGRLLQAFERLELTPAPDLVLVGKKEGFITGDGEVLRAAQALGGRAVFTGEVPEALLRQYYRHAEGLVFPSLYEGFGLPPLEAMASGLPVAVSNAASLPEVCGDAAVYFNPLDCGDMAQKIREILEPRKRAWLMEAGRRQAAQFTWERGADQTTQVIRGLLGI